MADSINPNEVPLDPASLISPVLAQDDKATIKGAAHVTWSFAAAAW